MRSYFTRTDEHRVLCAARDLNITVAELIYFATMQAVDEHEGRRRVSESPP